MDLSSLSTEMNIATCLERLSGDPAFLLELMDMLFSEFNAEKSSLLERLSQEDFQYLGTKAHYYKGIAANLELTNFLAAATALEQSARSANETACKAYIQQLIASAQRIEPLLQGIVRD